MSYQSSYNFGWDCGHLETREAQEELDKVGLMTQEDYDAFWDGYAAFQDDAEELEEMEDAEYDGQPSEYDEWQDYMGGDDWDHGQFDSCGDW